MVNFLGEAKQSQPDRFRDDDNDGGYMELAEHLITGELPAKRDPFDPAPLLDLFKKYHSEIDKMANKSMGLMVTDDQSLELATVFTTQAKALNQTIEKKRVEVKAPYLEVVKVLDGETKGLKDRLAQIQAYINEKIRPYLQKKEVERKEAEKLAQEEAARIQAELDAKAEAERQAAAEEARKAAIAAGMSKKKAEAQAQAAAAMVEDAPTVVAQALPDETKVTTETGSAKLKEKLVGELIDIRLVPDACIQARWEELKKAVQPYINAQIAAGARNVPGFKIQKVAKIETRTSYHRECTNNYQRKLNESKKGGCRND